MTRFTSIVAVTLLVALPAVTPAGAQPGHGIQRAAGLAIPVVSTTAGATFTGTFTLQRFVATRDGVAALGLLTGVGAPTGSVPTSIVQNVLVPVRVQTLPPAAGDAVSIAQLEPPCPILHLDLGPLFLDLLGLQVDLSQVTLDVRVQPGSGNLLGNLLCAVTGLLDSPGGLSRLLNQILGILG